MSGTEVRPLPIHPWPVDPEIMQMIKDAKARMGVEWKVMPRPAVPGATLRVLAVGTPAPFVADQAVLRLPVTAEGMFSALEWATSDKEDPRALDWAGWLSHVLGIEVTELESEPLPEPTVAFR